MTDDDQMPSGIQRMTGLDGAFLAFESPTTHLHIVGAMIFDPLSLPEGGVLTYHRIHDAIASRVHLVPPFRKRLVEVPFGLQHPSLVDDPDFNVDFHIRRTSLPRPGGPKELAGVIGDISSRPLDRRRPLWEFHVVEGLEHGYVALVSKVHHAIIDGVSGAEVLAMFFDLSSEGSTHHQVGQVWDPQPLPGEVDSVRQALGSIPAQTEIAARTLGQTIRTMRSLNGRNREIPGMLPPSPFEAPRTSINKAISPHRRAAFAEVPLVDVKRVRQILGGTVNDVVLTVVAGAMRSFFEQRGEELERSLVAMVPISVRADDQKGTLGNRVSAMLVSLATGVEDPSARLRLIRDGMVMAKEQQQAVGSEVFSSWAQALFPAVATRASKLLSNLRLFDHLPPMFNVIVSNIPGPDFPLYMAGARMVAMYPFGPIMEGAGVNVTVFSYQGTMYFGIQSCWDLVPDIEVIAAGLRDSLDSLVKEADRRDRPVPWWHSDAAEGSFGG